MFTIILSPFTVSLFARAQERLHLLCVRGCVIFHLVTIIWRCDFWSLSFLIYDDWDPSSPFLTSFSGLSLKAWLTNSIVDNFRLEKRHLILYTLVKDVEKRPRYQAKVTNKYVNKVPNEIILFGQLNYVSLLKNRSFRKPVSFFHSV